MKEKLKKHWKNILIIVLCLFGLQKCTQSCNRGMTIKKQTTEITSKDSLIEVLKADTLDKAHQIDMLGEKINTADARTETAKANEETAKANEKVQTLQNKLNRQNRR